MFAAYSPDKSAKQIGSRKQLFIDDDIIACVKNVTRRQHTPKKHPMNPLIKNDQPWESHPYFRHSTFNVIRDAQDGLYKCWYEDFHNYFGLKKGEFIRERLCYAQSVDGLNWEKPALGKHIIDGHSTNIVIDRGPNETYRGPSVILDSLEPDPSRRYKMVYLLIHKDQGRGGLCMSHSPDGVDWTVHDGNPVLPEWQSDVEILTYDPIDRKYVLWGRYSAPPLSSHPDSDGYYAPIWPSKPEGIWGTRRRIYRLESPDLVEWSDAELIFDPGEDDNLDDSHYGFVPWRSDEMHLGLLTVFHQVDNTLDMYLLHGRDGRNWKRFLDHRPFIPRGGEGSYDQWDIETATQPFVVGDELWIYYGGMNVHHDWWIVGKSQGLDVPEAHDPEMAKNGHHLCLATLRLDGYVSLDATIREGYVETKPLSTKFKRLHINGRCRSDGYIQVEVMDTWGNIWPGFSRTDCETFTGDSVRHNFKWSGGDNISEIPGNVKLRIHVRNAEVFGFQFND
jgi:hypothetical protein